MRRYGTEQAPRASNLLESAAFTGLRTGRKGTAMDPWNPEQWSLGGVEPGGPQPAWGSPDWTNPEPSPTVAAHTPAGAGEQDLIGESGETGNGPVSGIDDHLLLFTDGALWDLGPASDDADADGVPESLTRGAGDGVTVYSDRDLDGRIDRITELDGAGGCRVSDLDPRTGRWSPVGLGRLD